MRGVSIQGKLFGGDEIEGLGDLERLRLMLEHMPDEGLMRKLEREEGDESEGGGKRTHPLCSGRVKSNPF